jgi:hypothetical protein
LPRIRIQTLVIIWWLGAITAAVSLLAPTYAAYVVIGVGGWSVVAITTALIIYELKRIKEEDKKKQLAEK